MRKKYKQLGSEKINSLIIKLGRRCQRCFGKDIQGYIISVSVTNQWGSSLTLQTVTIAYLLEKLSRRQKIRPGP